MLHCKKMGARCSSLSNFENVCAIGNCMKGVRGLPSNSASPSDVFLMALKPGVRYMGSLVSNAIAKVTVTSGSYRNNVTQLHTGGFIHINPNVAIQSLQSLEYEYLIYGNVTKLLIEYKVCPFFVKVYGIAYNCTYDNMLQIVGLDKLDEFKRNVYWYLNSGEKRPAIDNPSMDLWMKNWFFKKQFVASSFDPNNKLSFNMIVSEIMSEPSAVSFSSFEYSSNVYEPSMQPTMWSYLFQVAVACYALQCTRTVHQDLHHENLFIVTLPAVKEMYLTVDDVTYVLQTKRQVAIYDFDRAYCEPLGLNPVLPLFEWASQNYTIGKCKDFLKFMGYCYDSAVPADKANILGLFSEQKEAQDSLQNVWQIGMYLQQSVNTAVDDVWFDQFDDYPVVIQRLAVLANIGLHPVNSVPGDSEYYTLQRNMFTSKGFFIRPNSSSEQNLMNRLEVVGEEMGTIETQLEAKQSELEVLESDNLNLSLEIARLNAVLNE